MFHYSVSCFDEVSWFVSVYLELLPSGLINDEI